VDDSSENNTPDDTSKEVSSKEVINPKGIDSSALFCNICIYAGFQIYL
jgi:hypothetical protein